MFSELNEYNNEQDNQNNSNAIFLIGLIVGAGLMLLILKFSEYIL